MIFSQPFLAIFGHFSAIFAKPPCTTQQFSTAAKLERIVGKVVVKQNYEMSFNFIIKDFEITPTGTITTKPFLSLGNYGVPAFWLEIKTYQSSNRVIKLSAANGNEIFHTETALKIETPHNVIVHFYESFFSVYIDKEFQFIETSFGNSDYNNSVGKSRWLKTCPEDNLCADVDIYDVDYRQAESATPQAFGRIIHPFYKMIKPRYDDDDFDHLPVNGGVRRPRNAVDGVISPFHASSSARTEYSTTKFQFKFSPAVMVNEVEVFPQPYSTEPGTRLSNQQIDFVTNIGAQIFDKKSGNKIICTKTANHSSENVLKIAAMGPGA